MRTKLREGIRERWRELRATELVLDGIAAEFDGEDAALPKERRALAEAKERLEELREAAQKYAGPFKLPEPEEKDLELVREVVRREKGWHE